jgi:putative FmdB family regulatory protein
MPLYEYRCPSCESAFEQLVRNGQAVACPQCGHAEPQRLMSAAFGRVAAGHQLPMTSSCPPADAPPCSPHCCRLPSS